jgi:hypothetical protein
MTGSCRADGQARVDAFLRDFVAGLKKGFGPEIDFVLLFGSAARGEFVLGKSDVDLVIQVKGNAMVGPVEAFAEKLFWKLDKKHGTMLRGVCSTGIGKSLLENALKAVEKQARLYKPFEVFGPNDIDWNRGMIKRLDLMPGAILVASQLTLLYKMKHEGKILFGRDIRKEIRPRFTLWEKLKSIWVPQSISLAAIIISLALPKKAVEYASKAVFYELGSASMALHGNVPIHRGKERQLRRFAEATRFRAQFLDAMRFYLELKFGLVKGKKIEFVERAARVKKEGFSGGRLEALGFCTNAFWIIYATNSAIVLKTLFGNI